MNKYISLYEDYTNVSQKVLPKLYTWSDIRDAINHKDQFMIIDFKNQDSMDQCIHSELHKMEYSEQSYTSIDSSGNVYDIPSAFVFYKESDPADFASSLIKRFKINRIILGESGAKYPKLITKEDSSEYSSDIMSGISPSDVGMDDYYKNGSTYYKFIN